MDEYEKKWYKCTIKFLEVKTNEIIMFIKKKTESEVITLSEVNKRPRNSQ